MKVRKSGYQGVIINRLCYFPGSLAEKMYWSRRYETRETAQRAAEVAAKRKGLTGNNYRIAVLGWRYGIERNAVAQ